MAPAIRYAASPGGARIAYATLGEGPPVVFMPPIPFSHVEASWELPGLRRWFEGLARDAEVALYDAPGIGMSARDPSDFSIEAMASDLDAIVHHLGWREFALCGFFNAAPPAIAFAAAHPDAVTELVLWGGFAQGTTMYPLPLTVDPAMAASYWDMFVDTAARSWTAGSGEEARRTAEYFRACVEPAVAMQAFAAARAYDVRALLGQVTASTLVIQRRDAATQRIEQAQLLASGIPGAQLLVLPGEAASPFSGDIDAGVRAVAAFLGVDGSIDQPAEVFVAASERLTVREAEVLRLVARGLTNKEIGVALSLSINTVERHLTNLYPKIGCRGRTEATAFALTHGYS